MKPQPSVIEQNRHVGTPAIVFGNGAQRRLVDPDKVALEDIIIIGSNAFGEEHYDIVDYIVSVDPRSWEYKLSRVNEFSSRAVYVNAGQSRNVADAINGRPIVHWWPFGGREGNMSGVQAILLAKWMGCDPVIISGFDNDGTSAYDITNPDLPERARHAAEYLYGVTGSRPVNPKHGQEARLESCLARVAREWKVSPMIEQLPRHSFKWANPEEIPPRWKA